MEEKEEEELEELELEEKRRENNIKGKLGNEGFKRYKELKHKIYESRNLNSKVK